MISEKLAQAAQLIKAGNHQAAIPILREILQTNPRDENAWLWLYSCVSQAEQKKYCLQKALEINPGNQGARNALNKLIALPPQPLQPAVPTNTVSSQATPIQVEPKEESKPAVKVLPRILASSAVLLLILCVAAFFILANTGRLSAFSSNLPFFPTSTSTPSLTPVPTFTASVTPSPSPTITASPTHRLTWTPFPGTATTVPSPTIPPFTLGNPTATPWGTDITDQNFRKGLQAYKDEDFAAVIELMNLVIQAQPELAPPYRYRGMAYWSLGDCSSATDDLEYAVSIAPDYASAWAGLGLTNECLGNEQQALQDYQKALSLDPSLAVVHHNLGAHYFGKGDYEKSLEEYNLSLAIDPTRSSTWSNRGFLLTQLGRFDECMELANNVLAANSQAWYAYVGRGACESGNAMYTVAIKDFKTYLSKKPDDSSALQTLGYAYGYRADAYFEAKNYTAAVPDYEKAVSLVTDNAHFYCYLSESYLLTKRYKKAINAAETSRSIDPECGKVRGFEIEARAYYALGDYDQAIEYMNKALAAGPYKLGYYYRGIMYQAAGEKEKAIQDLEHFLSLGYDGNQEKNANEDAKARLANLAP